MRRARCGSRLVGAEIECPGQYERDRQADDGCDGGDSECDVRQTQRVDKQLYSLQRRKRGTDVNHGRANDASFLQFFQESHPGPLLVRSGHRNIPKQSGCQRRGDWSLVAREPQVRNKRRVRNASAEVAGNPGR